MKLKSIDRAIRKIGSLPKYVDPTVYAVDTLRRKHLSGKFVKGLLSSNANSASGGYISSSGIYGPSGSISSKFK